MGKSLLIDILDNPEKYTADQRKIAAKMGIEILNKMAINDGAKEQAVKADALRCGACSREWQWDYVYCPGCGALESRTA